MWEDSPEWQSYLHKGTAGFPVDLPPPLYLP